MTPSRVTFSQMTPCNNTAFLSVFLLNVYASDCSENTVGKTASDLLRLIKNFKIFFCDLIGSFLKSKKMHFFLFFQLVSALYFRQQHWDQSPRKASVFVPSNRLAKPKLLQGQVQITSSTMKHQKGLYSGGLWRYLTQVG